MRAALRIVWTHPPSRAVALVFAFVSSLYGTWLVRIPEVQHALALSEGDLGWALLGMPVGMMLVLPAAGWIIARFGAGQTTLVAALVFAVVLPGPALAASGWHLAGALFGIGLADGLLNVAMNARASAVEEQRDTPILSTCHGFFSVGGMVGAGIGSITAYLSIPLSLTLFGVAVLGILVVARSRDALTHGPTRTSIGPVVALPNAALVGVGALVFCILLSEGAVSGWSAVYLRNALDASPAVAGLGYAAFSLTMAVGRFYGDRWTEHIGRIRMVQVGAGVAGLALALTTWIAHPVAAIVGFAIMGIGYATLVPILFRAAARTPGLAPGTSLAAVAGIGYAGLFLGPPALGTVADVYSLDWVVGILAGLSLLVAFAAAPLLPDATPSTSSPAPQHPEAQQP